MVKYKHYSGGNVTFGHFLGQRLFYAYAEDGELPLHGKPGYQGIDRFSESEKKMIWGIAYAGKVRSVD